MIVIKKDSKKTLIKKIKQKETLRAFLPLVQKPSDMFSTTFEKS